MASGTRPREQYGSKTFFQSEMATWLVCASHISQLSARTYGTQRCSPAALHGSQLSLISSLFGPGDPSKIRYVLRLCVHTRWSDARDQSYNGGNSLPSDRTQLAQDMQSIRQTIFSSSSGTIDSTVHLSTYAKSRLTVSQRY